MKALADVRCAVVGAGGFIGTNLCRALAGKVRRLRAFGRRQLFPGALQGIEWYAGDFSEGPSLAAALEGFDTVVHLANAATPASANIDKIGDLNANVVPTIRLLDTCRQLGVKRVVFASSGGTVYGVPEILPTPETAATWPLTAYGVSKLAIEKYLALYRHLYGLDCRILRVANPFGPFQVPSKNQGVIAAFLFQVMAGAPLEIWGDGSVTRDYLFIDDLVDALIRAMTHEGNDFIFNIGSGEGRSLNEVIRAMEVVLDRRIEIRYLEGREFDVPASVLDITRAREKLLWGPRIGFEQGLIQAASWVARYAAQQHRLSDGSLGGTGAA